MENIGQISYNNIKHIFENETTFSNQLLKFLNEIQLTDMEIKTRYESICTHLDEIFKVVFPKSKTYKFGSTQTGLGFKGCDLDIYLDIGEPIHETKNASADSWTMETIFKVVRKIMYRMGRVFSDIIPIPKAKTPIIKFCYVQTNVFCDISFKNSLALYKTYLIKYCISLDTRLKPLMILIKYWARHFRISGNGRISNYGLVLLIIFYLQQPSVNIIPPLMKLQSTCQPQVINGWQVNFDTNVVLPPITNKDSIPQLLRGFFIFYATFVFESQVICLLDGMIRTKSEFTNIESLPFYMDRYKTYVNINRKLNTNIPMCVQDPIELSHNVTTSIQFHTLHTFVQYCTIGAEICAVTNKDDYRDLLNSLFSTVLKTETVETKFKIIISANNFQHLYELNNKESCIDMVEKSKSTKSDWYFTVFNIVKDIFEKVFKVQVKILTDDVEAKQQKIILHCTGSHCVWYNRKFTSVILDPSLSSLEKEAFISEQMIKNYDKEKLRNEIYLNFICIFEKHVHAQKIVLTISNQNYDKHVFRKFENFAKHKLCKIVEQTLIFMHKFNKCY
ncbi:uncharacterized protein LOC143151431 isoform X2 [Ptiloglossa arizonensis]